MTAALKAHDLVYKKFLPLMSAGNEKINVQVAKQCAILFTEQMLTTFQKIVEVYSKDFQKSVKFWLDVREEILSL